MVLVSVRSSITGRAARCRSWPSSALPKQGRETGLPSAWAIGRMSRPGKTCWTISKRGASKRLIGGEVDGNQAMLNALTKKFPDCARQRCVVHKMDHVFSYVPTKQQEQLKPELKALFYQKDRRSADQAVAADHSRTISGSTRRPSRVSSVIWRCV